MQEHGDVDDANMHLQVSAIATASNCASVVRVAAPEAFLLKRALDTGANSIMTPMMNTAVRPPASVKKSSSDLETI